MVTRTAGLTRQWRVALHTFQSPRDIWLSLQLGYFIWRTPAQLERMSLPDLLGKLRQERQTAQATYPQLVRLSRPWFKLAPFRAYNTCYLRALLFYRFLAARDRDTQIQFVVEPGRDASALLHGHAWVTIAGERIEPPDAEILARSRGIYAYPPELPDLRRK